MSSKDEATLHQFGKQGASYEDGEEEDGQEICSIATCEDLVNLSSITRRNAQENLGKMKWNKTLRYENGGSTSTDLEVSRRDHVASCEVSQKRTNLGHVVTT